MLVGHVAQIWRYPVKSTGGEVIDSALLVEISTVAVID